MAVRVRAELLDGLRSCFARTQTWLHAANTVGERLPTPAFIATIQAIVDHVAGAGRVDIYTDVAVRRLARVLREYRAVQAIRGDGEPA